ncbi:transporter substrate-binding domain-containing protein [Micromonospora sp. NBC_01699]|uniref:substrate-binding periplasmic protein n=1 Tax=Micromonospora sp. NBC_01699 TaxID=2975984 RepID=UPI002E2BDF36|nr:transporter substrate-binding domain-containing protein [Micromonospora sp. NBC_01699]
MTPNSRRLSALLKPLRSWAPALVLVAAVVVATGIVAIGLRGSPTTPSRAVLVSSGSWAPFVGPELPSGGPVTRLVVEVLSRSGYSPEVRYTSWSLAEEQVAAGATVGAFPLVGSESRRTDFLLSDPLVDFEYVLFYNRRNGEPTVSSAADLGALRVGAIDGYDYWGELESAVDEFVRFGSALEGFRALADGRIDVLAEGLLSGRAVLADPSFAGDAADFGHLPGDNPLVHSMEGLYFMMADSNEAATVMARFNATLAKMRQSQEYEDIVADLEPSGRREVTLIPVGGTGLVELLDQDGKLVLLAPKGTRAQVLAWPEAFGASPGPPPDRILVRVKVTNGPAQGRVLHVDARALLLGTEPS